MPLPKPVLPLPALDFGLPQSNWSPLKFYAVIKVLGGLLKDEVGARFRGIYRHHTEGPVRGMSQSLANLIPEMI